MPILWKCLQRQSGIVDHLASVHDKVFDLYPTDPDAKQETETQDHEIENIKENAVEKIEQNMTACKLCTFKSACVYKFKRHLLGMLTFQRGNPARKTNLT